MVKKFFNFRTQLFVLTSVALISTSCGGDAPTNEEEDVQEEVNPKQSQLMEIEGKVFSIPSPIQTATLIKNSGTNYNKEMLNVPSNVTKYSTNFKKAINLGVYGADLGYVTLYEQTQDAISFLTAIKSIGDDLGVSSAFDMELVNRFEKNIGNQDSILAMVSDAYKASDRYLKNSQQNDVGGLILAGGWIESLYFATNAAKMTNNKEIIKRIGEQKTTVSNLIKLLTPYYSKSDYTALVDNLIELDELFSKIEIVYTYVKPTVDAKNKTTTINSTTDVNITPEQLNAITEKVNKIRTELIN
ncbi:MAG: hypothetical protein KF732_04140 [Flavobacteriales bacterium]|nr:hypothetical protein [Flavobacteriales bacterium]MBX2959127.1 hypothetical protein [Flavobacteriales bacterium]HRN40672.1 hypothetical protein [Vicingus sp.]HRP59638.1 hypothetical protein [Vicingus sp.]